MYANLIKIRVVDYYLDCKDTGGDDLIFFYKKYYDDAPYEDLYPKVKAKVNSCYMNTKADTEHAIKEQLESEHGWMQPSVAIEFNVK